MKSTVSIFISINSAIPYTNTLVTISGLHLFLLDVVQLFQLHVRTIVILYHSALNDTKYSSRQEHLILFCVI